jgi:hypothetical protein
MLSYTKKTAHGFTWTSDTVRGRLGFTRHRLYLDGDREHCLAIVSREKGMYHLKIVGSVRKRSFGELRKAKATAENFICKNFHQLGFKLVRRKA